MFDNYQDNFFQKQETTEKELSYLKGQLNILEDIIGLAHFLKSFKEVKQVPNLRIP